MWASAGTIRISGMELSEATRDEILPLMGIMIESPEFRAKSTASEVLELHIAMLDCTPEQSVTEILQKVGLEGSEKAQVSSFSLGMKQRLALARAMIHSPKLLILDEPNNGLDPTGVVDLRNLLERIAASGTAIIVASHVLTELERSAHTVAVLNHGSLSLKRDIGSVLEEYEGGLEAFYHHNIHGGVQ
ncbi:ATP-binding cassette domain-containing protein [Corynebacterium felinum]